MLTTVEIKLVKMQKQRKQNEYLLTVPKICFSIIDFFKSKVITRFILKVSPSYDHLKHIRCNAYGYIKKETACRSYWKLYVNWLANPWRGILYTQDATPWWNPYQHGEGAYQSKRSQPSASTRTACRSNAATFNKNKHLLHVNAKDLIQSWGI